ncbi:hypothetical protein DKM44_14245 [Deinococcus irradiatisoli]|uniref:Uncharacterized protein n=1 Tax=Deinococcus irradiatisoli TaxID=2202254 RepID=A0A2Z3JGG3_9DEIO|nr:hypothetical protein [Deinococcus irradiatisoli]AWN24247.1 hypothetical protein DKM44_14245 [Deinococcus irradiatisoli]
MSTPTPTPPGTQTHPQEHSVLPVQLYPALFWLALPVLALSLLVPGWANLGVWFMMGVPTLAAVVVLITKWREDRRVSLAALSALVGLGLVVVVKSLI